MGRFQSTEERDAFLAEVAERHYQWEQEVWATAPFTPSGRPDPSDYNLHYADVESDPEQEAAIQEAWTAAGLTAVLVQSTPEEQAAVLGIEVDQIVG